MTELQGIASDPQRWLVGPIGTEALDLCFKKAFPHCRFFDAHRPLQAQYALTEEDIILCLEPFQRLMPPQFWDLKQMCIAVAEKPAAGFSEGFGDAFWAPTLSQLAAWVPVNGTFSADECQFLARYGVQVTSQIWTFAPHHFVSAQRPALFESAYITPYAWQEAVPLHPKLQYFVQSNASRVSFYFPKTAQIFCPVPFSHPYPLQMMAAGAQVCLPRETSDIPDRLAPWVQRVDMQEPAPALEQSEAVPHAELMPFALGQRLPEVLACLPSGVNREPLAVSALILDTGRLLQSQNTQVLDVLARLLKEPVIVEQTWFPLADCGVYLRFILGEFVPDAQQKEHLFRYVLGQSKRISVEALGSLCQFLVYRQRNNFTSALQALQGVLEQPPFEALYAFLHLIQEEVFLDICAVPGLMPRTRVLAWLRFQEAFIFAHTEAQERAAELLSEVLSAAPFPTLASLWCALGDYRADTATALRWKRAFPLHIWVGLKYVEALGREPERDPVLIRQTLHHLKSLCLRLNGSSHELERVLAYLRLYLPPEPSGATVVQWEGPLYANSSLAQINAYWLQALEQDPTFIPVHIPFEPPEQAEPVVALSLGDPRSDAPSIFVSHRWPPRAHPPEAGRWVSIVPWEFGAIPTAWVQRMNQALQEVWVPSEYVAHSFWRSGVRRDKIQVIPNGVDCSRFSPAGAQYSLKTQRGFCFLFVGGAIHRKGLDLLLQAYVQAFSQADDVCLVIKSFGENSHYALQSLGVEVPENGPEIEYIREDLSAEAMASLYRRCQVYVHPYRGEGFGMPILEAMACGTPVIIPDAGPAPEFCSEAAGWYLPTRIASDPALNIAGQGLAPVHAYFSVVDVNDLAHCMRERFGQGAEASQAKGKQAAQEAATYDWQRLYPRVKTRLLALSQPQQSFALTEPLPARLYLENDWGLLPLSVTTSISTADSTAEVAFVTDPELAGLRLHYCLNPAHAQTLIHLHQRGKLGSDRILCGSLKLAQDLHAQGLSLNALRVHPLQIQTRTFHAQVPPVPLEESTGRFSFLLCFDWRQQVDWQDVILAYASVFDPETPVHLIFKPYHVDFEAFIAAFMTWFEASGLDEALVPDITFMQEDLSEDMLPGFLRGVDCFIDLYSEPLALAAIASEVPVISASELPCLQRPAAERFRRDPRTGAIQQASLRGLLFSMYRQQNPLQVRHASQDLRTRQQAQGHWQKALIRQLQKQSEAALAGVAQSLGDSDNT